MPIYAVKLFFTAPLHAGELGLGMEETASIIHSDTLYGAIHKAWHRLYTTEGPLPFKLTTAFPFVGKTYYLPKPRLVPPGFENDHELRETYAKAVKDTGYLALDTFGCWLKNCSVDYLKMVEENELLGKHIKVEGRPRVTVDRLDCSSALYHVSAVHFRQGKAGLYFLVDCSEDCFVKLQSVVRLLEEEGLGGERSSGYGRFAAEFIKDFTLPECSAGKRFVSLSLYHPASQEEFRGALASYQLLIRGGWTESNKGNRTIKRIIMFSEGSVFNKQVEGMVQDVSPSGYAHPVWRFGRAFLVKAR